MYIYIYYYYNTLDLAMYCFLSFICSLLLFFLFLTVVDWGFRNNISRYLNDLKHTNNFYILGSCHEINKHKHFKCIFHERSRLISIHRQFRKKTRTSPATCTLILAPHAHVEITYNFCYVLKYNVTTMASAYISDLLLLLFPTIPCVDCIIHNWQTQKCINKVFF